MGSLVSYISAKTPRKLDGQWSWLACAAGTIAWALCFGVVNCYAVIMPVIMDQFNSSREATAWAGSIPSSLSFASIPVCSKVVSRIDIRLGALLGAGMCLLSLVVTSYAKSLLHMFFSYSILYGLGCSMLFSSIIIAMTKYFKKRQGIALGCVSGGLNLGILTLGPLIQVLMDNYGYRSMLRIIASMLIAVLLFLLTFDPNVQKAVIVTDGELVEEEEQEIGFVEGLKLLTKRPIYIIGVISLTLQTLTGFVTHVHLISYCKEVGIEPSQASNLYIAIGLSSLVSSIVAGRVIDIATVDPIHVNQVSSLTLALSMLLVQLATKYYHFVIYSVFLGIGCGILVTTIVLVLLRTVEPRLRSVSFPFGELFISIGNLTGPPLIGFIADKTGSYKPAFYTAGGICLLSFFIPFLQYCFKPCRRKPGDMTYSVDECETYPLNPTNETERTLQTEGTTENALLIISMQNPEPSNMENKMEMPANNSVQEEVVPQPQENVLPVKKDVDDLEEIPLSGSSHGLPPSEEIHKEKENDLSENKEEDQVLIPIPKPQNPEDKEEELVDENELLLKKEIDDLEAIPLPRPSPGKPAARNIGNDDKNVLPVIKGADEPDVHTVPEQSPVNLESGDKEEQQNEEPSADETSDTSLLNPKSG